jgi:hypothetical protein
LLIPAFVAMGTMLQTQEANAAIATTLLDPSAGVQFLEDNNWEQIQNTTGSPLLFDQGDIVYGMQVIQTVNSGATSLTSNVPFTGETFTAIFVARVRADASISEDLSPINFEAVDAATFASLTGFAPTGTGTISVVFSDAFTGAPVNAVDPGDPGGTTSAIQTAVGTPLWEFGFTGAGGTAAGDELFVTEINEANLGAFDSSDIVRFYAGLNVTHQYPDGIPLEDVNNLAALGLAPAQLQFQGVTDEALPAGSNFAFGTNTNFYINAVPEPSTTMALAGMIGMGIVGLVIRRRK